MSINEQSVMWEELKLVIMFTASHETYSFLCRLISLAKNKSRSLLTIQFYIYFNLMSAARQTVNIHKESG